MEEIFERYEILSKDVKYQINFIDDCYSFDFENLNETLKEMEQLQKKIKQNQIEQFKK
jgi:hypothetical protein